MDQTNTSRRSFLLATGSAWLTTNWAGIAAAAGHAAHIAAAVIPKGFEFLSAGDGADVEALTVQIVPSGATPGAREAHAAYFIDHSLATFFSTWAADFRTGLADFQQAFQRAQPGAGTFAAAASADQLKFLLSVDKTPFFESVRTLTILGMLASPKYGGNFEQSGWRLLGFEDQHAFAPPFGHYDREYTGFVPYDTGVKS
jgi:gluconate 2-dehydrogenase gamma chain